MNRNNRLAWFFGGWAAVEACLSVGYLKRMAKGWKLLSCWGLAFLIKNYFVLMSSYLYNPSITALLRKHQGKAKENLFDINDTKKSYFYIDTSQYMNYTNRDL